MQLSIPDQVKKSGRLLFIRKLSPYVLPETKQIIQNLNKKV